MNLTSWKYLDKFEESIGLMFVRFEKIDELAVIDENIYDFNITYEIKTNNAVKEFILDNLDSINNFLIMKLNADAQIFIKNNRFFVGDLFIDKDEDFLVNTDKIIEILIDCVLTDIVFAIDEIASYNNRR